MRIYVCDRCSYDRTLLLLLRNSAAVRVYARIVSAAVFGSFDFFLSVPRVPVTNRRLYICTAYCYYYYYYTT